MSRELLLGIDLGTTVLKAAAFESATGRALASASVRLPVRSEADGTREQDPWRIERALGRAAGELRSALGAAWNRIAGIGLAAQAGSAIIADRATGRALTPMQLWNDTRPLGQLADIARRRPAGYWRRLSYQSSPGAGLARIEWLRERHPRLFTGDNIYVGAGEYSFFTLTGVWRQDAGNALQIGCYDARRHRLAARPLAVVGAPADFVAPMRAGHATQPLSDNGARLLGLPARVPVAGPYFDHEAGYLATAGVSRRPLQCSLGTAWVGNFVLPPGPPPPGLNLVVPSPVDRANLVVRVMLAGSASWDWAWATLAGGGPSKPRPGHSSAGAQSARADAILNEGLLPPNGLVALPWLTRPNWFDAGLFGGGAFLGVNSHTSRADLLRALIAGLSFEFVRVFEPALATGAIESIVLTGGASRSDWIRRILAALLAPFPVGFFDNDETVGPRGTLHAFGLKASPGAVRWLVKPGWTLRRRVRKQYEFYRQVCRSLRLGLGECGSLLAEYRQRRPG